MLREQSFSAQGKEIEMLKIEIQDLGCGFQVKNIRETVAIPNCFIVHHQQHIMSFLRDMPQKKVL